MFYILKDGKIIASEPVQPPIGSYPGATIVYSELQASLDSDATAQSLLARKMWSDKSVIAGDGIDFATLYISELAQSVPLTINGETVSATLEDNFAAVQLVSTTPDTDLVIQGLGQTIKIYVR
jgi:hypothetical protein